MESEINMSFEAQLLGSEITGEQRCRAAAELKRLGLPGARSEEYRFTPITRELEKVGSWMPAGESQVLPETVVACLVPGATGQVVVLVNGRFDPHLSQIKTEAGCTVSRLGSADSSVGTVADFTKDAFGALNTACWTEGVHIRVSAGAIISDPITIVHIQDAAAANVQVHARLFVHLETGSEVTVIHHTHTCGTHRAFHTFVDEVIVEAGARFNYYKLQNDSGKSLEVWNSTIRQADDSHVDTFTLTAGGDLVRNNFQIEINGERCESHFHGLYLLQGATLADNHTVVDHQKPNSFSNELYKGILDDRAKGVFNGKIFVRPHAQKTNAYQSNRNILLADTAGVNTKPQLEIWADDVKCSHGCTTGQLDEDALFYLRSRGLAEETAKAMLLYAFAAETMDTIKNPAVKQYIATLVGDRLHNNF